MREASYTDSLGRKWAVWLPDGLTDADASMGLPLGPPPLTPLGLPQDIEIRLHNELYARRIFTAEDAERRKPDIISALQATLKIEARKILDLFYNDGDET